MSAATEGAAADFPIAIIGAGFGGIGMAIRLLQSGFSSFTIFERADEIGGTWRDNHYPGAACDVPSLVYSLSFEPNPDWSRSFAPSGEIHDYLLGCVEKHGLRAHLRLRTAIVEARFDEARGFWELRTDGGERVTAGFVISCVGGLVDPAPPEIEGLDRFEGEVFHTARWRRDCKLSGKRVAVIGTGASAVQVVPSIAPEVARLSVFQRTPAWVLPRRDRGISGRQRRLFRRHPRLQKAFRWLLFGLSELTGPLLFLDSPRLSRLLERASLRHLKKSVRNPALREKLAPSFQLGCKRVLISDDYWSSLERENVELVTAGIEEVREKCLVDRAGGEHPADVIVLATGFALGLATAPFPIHGLRGASLGESWKRGAEAYKGVAVSGFPNWMMIMGPNTGPGHTSVLVYTEAQIEYILQCIRTLQRDELRYLDVKANVQARYNRRLQGRMRHMVWSSGCNSWYLSADGRNHALYPGFASEYCARIRRFQVGDYQCTPANAPTP